MKTNKKILIYDLFLTLIGIVLNWRIFISIIQGDLYLNNKIWIITTGAILIPFFLLNAYCFFKTKERHIGIINIIVPMIFALFATLPSTLISMNTDGISLATFASLYPLLIGARFQYNIAFYFKVKYNSANSIGTQNSITVQNFVAKLFTILPTFILCITAVGVLSLLFVTLFT